jgi:hypothetical protein
MFIAPPTSHDSEQPRRGVMFVRSYGAKPKGGLAAIDIRLLRSQKPKASGPKTQDLGPKTQGP